MNLPPRDAQKYSDAQIRRAEALLAKITGVRRSLKATGVDRLDFVELHVDDLVALLTATGKANPST